MRFIADKIGGFILLLIGSLLTIYTVVDAIDGSFRYVSKTQGVYEVSLINSAFDFYFGLAVQVGIGLLAVCSGLLIFYKPKLKNGSNT